MRVLYITAQHRYEYKFCAVQDRYGCFIIARYERHGGTSFLLAPQGSFHGHAPHPTSPQAALACDSTPRSSSTIPSSSGGERTVKYPVSFVRDALDIRKGDGIFVSIFCSDVVVDLISSSKVQEDLTCFSLRITATRSSAVAVACGGVLQLLLLLWSSPVSLNSCTSDSDRYLLLSLLPQTSSDL